MSRFRLAYLADTNELKRVRHGVYALNNDLIDEYGLLQKGSNKVIFPYHTALYFHDLVDRTPSQIHITGPQGYNASRLKKRNNHLVVHYVQKDILELGTEMTVSPFGGEIIIYDVERCICDLVKDQEKIDSLIFTDAIKRYFSKDKINTRRLIRYAKQLGVEQEIRQYIKVLR